MHEQPAPTFETPLALLRACHGRVERFADLAARIPDHLAGDGTPDEAAIRAAGRVLRYFDQAAPLHHADEEADLLPRLRARLPATETPAVLAGLAAEHEGLEGHWRALRPHLERLAQGRAVPPATLRPAAEAFRDAQLDHLSRENTRILPAAEAHLTPADWAAIGEAMARRRGVGQNNAAAHGDPS